MTLVSRDEYCWPQLRQKCAQLPVGIVYGQNYGGIWSPSHLWLSFLINENILGKCFRSGTSSHGPWISPLACEYECPRQSLLIIGSQTPEPTKWVRAHVPSYHAELFKLLAPSERFNFLKVNVQRRRDHTVKCNRRTPSAPGSVGREATGAVVRPPASDASTTSFLNAAI